MPTLTRRRSSPRHDSWHVYYGDIQVGTIGRRSGVPLHVDQWDWTCGILPGMHPRDHRHGTGADIDACRAAFKKAWDKILPTLTEENFQEWRDQRDFTAWKYEMWDRGCKMPTEFKSLKSVCFCGAEIDNAGALMHIREHHRVEERC